jgi:phage replication-related protein YjqB (UPF0714/DUF867 family)
MGKRHEDKYKSFARLKAGERAGVDYCRTIRPQNSEIAVIAPHGGGIEPGTSEIATAIAGDQFSLYCFEGLKTEGNYRDLHITGTNFNDPDCVELTGKSRVVLAIHGCGDDNEVVYVGGSNENIGAQLIHALKAAGFYVQKDETGHSGRNPQNICNRGLPEGGVQLEIAEGLRMRMFRSLKRHDRIFIQPPFETFVSVIRDALIRSIAAEAAQPARVD